jgi:hypothetical protein
MSNKDEILKRLAEVYCLVTESMCDGKPVVDLECFEDLDLAMTHLAQKVEYYLD